MTSNMLWNKPGRRLRSCLPTGHVNGPWASYLTSLNLSFIIYLRGMVPTSCGIVQMRAGDTVG